MWSGTSCFLSPPADGFNSSHSVLKQISESNTTTAQRHSSSFMINHQFPVAKPSLSSYPVVPVWGAENCEEVSEHLVPQGLDKSSEDEVRFRRSLRKKHRSLKRFLKVFQK